MKVKLTHKFWARAVAFFLCVIVLAAAAGCGALFIYGESEGWYSGDGMRYYDTWQCRSNASGKLYELLWNYSTNKTSATWKEIAAEPGYMGNLLYAIYDTKGELLLTNIREGDTGALVIDDTIISVDGERYICRAYVATPMEYADEFSRDKALFDMTYPHRWTVIELGAVLLLAGALLLIFLLCSAGHTADRAEPVLLRQDKIPLDLYLAGAVVLGFLLCAGIVELSYVSRVDAVLVLVCGVLLVLGLAVLVTAVCMSLAARFKVGAWWRSALIYKVLYLLWHWAKRFFAALPLIWKTVLCAGVVLFVNFLGLVSYRYGFSFGDLLVLIFDCAVALLACGAALQFHKLRQGAKELAEGRIRDGLDLSGLVLEYRAFGEDLNRVSDGMGRAVEERLKSERMKTELITNVSHDLKTPLTSIISYVDLLKKEPLGSEKAVEYVEVLDRQAHKLKKLTDDLVEASKASSGAMKVELACVDVRELLQQSIGEYTERMEGAGLTPVMSMPDGRVNVLADGRLLWRVFENLLQNICKYSMPGTRVYFSVRAERGRAYITAQNISAEQLNITAEELMARFVRGDASRSTEGSGLGLSIARSLTQLQGGEFSVYLDGDMFKAMVIFPLAEEPLDKTGA